MADKKHAIILKWIEALRRVAELEAELAEYKSIKVF